jgi:hypothetical protein
MFGYFERRRQKRLDGLWQQARAALAEASPQDALRALDRVIGEEPSDSEAFLLKADVLRRMDRAEDAEELLKNLLQWSDPGVRARAALRRARGQLQAGQWAKAQQMLPKAPPVGEHWLWLEAALRSAYELVQAEAFEAAIRGHWREPAAAELEDAAQRQRISAVYGLLGAYLEDAPAFRAPDGQDAEAQLRRALELWPGNEEARECLRELLEGGADEAEDEVESSAAARAPAELRALLLRQDEEEDWIAAVTALAGRGEEPAYGALLRLELAARAGSRADGARALEVLGSFEPPPELAERHTELARLAAEGRAPAQGTAGSAKAGPLGAEARVLFRLMTGQPVRAREALGELERQHPKAVRAPGGALLAGLVALQEGRYAEAVPGLNLARESARHRVEAFPRLVLAHLYAQDREGVDWTFSQWEKWLDVELAEAEAGQMAPVERALDLYLRFGDALSRLASYRLQGWVKGLLQRGLGHSQAFQLLFEADGRLRVLREGSALPVLELLQAQVRGLQPELASLLDGA